MSVRPWCIYCGTRAGEFYGRVCNGCLMAGQASRYNLPDPPPYLNRPPLDAKTGQVAPSRNPRPIVTLTVDETPEPVQRDWWPIVGWLIAMACVLLLLVHSVPVCKP